MIPRKPYLCNNKRCVVMSKAFLYWLMWCLSKHFSLNMMTFHETTLANLPVPTKAFCWALLTGAMMAGSGNVGRVLQAEPLMMRMDRLWLDKGGPSLVVHWGGEFFPPHLLVRGPYVNILAFLTQIGTPKCPQSSQCQRRKGHLGLALSITTWPPLPPAACPFLWGPFSQWS